MRLITIVLILDTAAISRAQTVIYHAQDVIAPNARFVDQISDGSKYYAWIQDDTVFNVERISSSGVASSINQFPYLGSPNNIYQPYFHSFGYHLDSGLIHIGSHYGYMCDDCIVPIVSRYDTNGGLLWIDTTFYNSYSHSHLSMDPMFWGDKTKILIPVPYWEEGDRNGSMLALSYNWQGDFIELEPTVGGYQFFKTGLGYSSIKAWCTGNEEFCTDNLIQYADTSLVNHSSFALVDASLSVVPEKLYSQASYIIDSSTVLCELTDAFESEDYQGVATVDSVAGVTWKYLPTGLLKNLGYHANWKAIRIESIICIAHIAGDELQLFALNNSITDTTMLWKGTVGSGRLPYRLLKIEYDDTDSTILLDFHVSNQSNDLERDLLKLGGIVRKMNSLNVSNQSIIRNAFSKSRIYPNPTSGQFTLQSDEAGHYSILNLSGQLIQEGVFEAGDNRLILPENLQIGVYWMRIEMGRNKVEISKIVLKP